MASAAPNLKTIEARIRPIRLGAGVFIRVSLGVAIGCVGCVPKNDLSSYSTEQLSESPSGEATPGADEPGPPVERQSDAAVVVVVSEMPPGEGTPLDVARQPPPSDGARGEASTDSGPVAPEDVIEAGPSPLAVVTWAPADGSLGVAADVELVLDFGRAMNTSSVVAALQADDGSLDGASFVWSEADSVLSVRSKPLGLASGTDPDLVEPLCYTYRITSAAIDAEGQAIEPSQIRFCTERRISQRFIALADRQLTGNFRSDGN